MWSVFYNINLILDRFPRQSPARTLEELFPVEWIVEARRADQVVQGVDCHGWCRVPPSPPFWAGALISPAARRVPSWTGLWEMVLAEREVGKQNYVLFYTNGRPIFRLVTFRKDYIRNLRILKTVFLKLPICSQTRWKTFVYLKGFLYFSLKTTSHHHLRSPRISQHYLSWNPGIHFPPYLLVPSVIFIAVRETFYKLKSCLVSASPLQMDSHCFGDKEVNSHHCLLALQDPDSPRLCSLPCTHHRGASWTCSSPPSTLVPPSHCSPSGMFFPPSLFTCCTLLKFQVFGRNFSLLGSFSKSHRG